MISRVEQTGRSNNLMRYGKRNAMVSDRYTFLTPECLWYPIATPPVDPVKPWLSEFDFTCFELPVFHDSDRTAISQGQGRANENGTCFIPPRPLPGISLCIGPYQRIVYGIDSVDFEIYSFQSSKEFTALFDGMPEGIRQGIYRRSMKPGYRCSYLKQVKFTKG